PRTSAQWRAVAPAPPTAAPGPPAAPGATTGAPATEVDAVALAAGATLRNLLALPENSDALRWMSIALLELGVSETGGDADRQRIAGYFRDTPLPASMHSPDTPWSAVWLNWVFARAGIPTPRSGSNAAWLAWGERLDGPRVGAVAVMPLATRGSAPVYHAGLVVRADPDCVLLVAGNTNNRVETRCYPPGRVQAFRWPPLR
ncbi:TIGR02594 family protein, partial [Falsiroseomonas oryzae]|uniref:TIGR02594 family protein n=1 Tax=Falsiroseomonas oryzae TaxID=2766473 RepID=UPI0022EB39F4